MVDSKLSLGFQSPITEEAIDQSFTQRPIEVREAAQVLTHRHFGHPKEHPVSLRHRKGSADPLHGEEDKIIDEYKDLFEKATKGECSQNEMNRIRDIKGRLDEINSSREMDAYRILGDKFSEAHSDGLSKSIDLAIRASSYISKGNRHYLGAGERPTPGQAVKTGPRGGKYTEFSGAYNAPDNSNESRDLRDLEQHEHRNDTQVDYDLESAEREYADTHPNDPYRAEAEARIKTVRAAKAFQDVWKNAGYDTEIEYWNDNGSDMFKDKDLAKFRDEVISDWGAYLDSGEMTWDDPYHILNNNMDDLKNIFASKHPNLSESDLDNLKDAFEGNIEDIWEDFKIDNGPRNPEDGYGDWDQDFDLSKDSQYTANVLKAVPSTVNIFSKQASFSQKPIN